MTAAEYIEYHAQLARHYRSFGDKRNGGSVYKPPRSDARVTEADLMGMLPAVVGCTEGAPVIVLDWRVDYHTS